MNKSEYLKYLQSKEWKNIRKKVYQERNMICELCGKKIEKKYHIHHTNYENIGKEKMEDLMLICEKCHKEIHYRGETKIMSFYILNC